MSVRHPLVMLGLLWAVICLALVALVVCERALQPGPVPAATPTVRVLTTVYEFTASTPTVDLSVTPRESVLAPTRTPAPPMPTSTPLPTITPTIVPARPPVQRG